MVELLLASGADVNKAGKVCLFSPFTISGLPWVDFRIANAHFTWLQKKVTRKLLNYY